MRREALALAGGGVLAVLSIAALPFERGLFRMPATPYDSGDARFVVPAFVVLRRAEPLIPPGASVLVRSEPANATSDTYLHRFGVALLPGRRIVPAARWGVPTEAASIDEAQYEIVVGASLRFEPGRLLLELPEGSVWKRGL